MPSFTLDPFQEKAIALIQRNSSVLVSAPTGAGKTLIAESAIDEALAADKTVIYTAPIKALSNQKFRDFGKHYGDRVGILTGDVSINPDAEILIMTTEIYRNSLFENSGRFDRAGWVIFDEIHYLDDPGRGTVWEEAILFSPSNIRILALSATVPNVKILADWIRNIHPHPIEVVEETNRPVPLEFLFQCQGKIIKSFKDLYDHGYMSRDSWRLSNRDRHRGFHSHLRAKPNRLDVLLHDISFRKRLPAIYFAFGRRRVEYLAWEAARFEFVTDSESRTLVEEYDALLARYDITAEKSAQELRSLIEIGIAYHHAGMLPTLKEVVEQLFTSRLLKLIFTTETFALGINMPAKSVVFDELEKYYDTGFKLLTTRDFYQMAGRAGRRGMDTEGFVYVRVNPQHVSFSGVKKILNGSPEPVESQLNTAYATLLNLYRNLGEKLEDIYPKTFHYFQSGKKKRAGGLGLIQNKLEMLKEMGYLSTGGLTPKGEFASSIFGYELYAGEMYADRVLDDLTEIKLNVLLSSLIFEPRKNDSRPKMTDSHKKLSRLAEHYSHLIHRQELKHKITPYTKMTHFHLALAVEAWSSGADFDRTLRLTTSDEGELVRHFRMIIQLLRELVHASLVPDKLKQTAAKAIRLINRGQIDAEKQLRS